MDVEGYFQELSGDSDIGIISAEKGLYNLGKLLVVSVVVGPKSGLYTPDELNAFAKKHIMLYEYLEPNRRKCFVPAEVVEEGGIKKLIFPQIEFDDVADGLGEFLKTIGNVEDRTSKMEYFNDKNLPMTLYVWLYPDKAIAEYILGLDERQNTGDFLTAYYVCTDTLEQYCGKT